MNKWFHKFCTSLATNISKKQSNLQNFFKKFIYFPTFSHQPNTLPQNFKNLTNLNKPTKPFSISDQINHKSPNVQNSKKKKNKKRKNINKHIVHYTNLHLFINLCMKIDLNLSSKSSSNKTQRDSEKESEKERERERDNGSESERDSLGV